MTDTLYTLYWKMVMLYYNVLMDLSKNNVIVGELFYHIVKTPHAIKFSGLSPINVIEILITSKNPSQLEGSFNQIDWKILKEGLNHNMKSCPPNFDFLFNTPHLFTYDYPKIMECMKPIAEELMANRFHPKNAELWAGWGFDEYSELCKN